MALGLPHFHPFPPKFDVMGYVEPTCTNVDTLFFLSLPHHGPKRHHLMARKATTHSIVMSIFSVPNAMQKHMLPENCPFDLNTAPIALGCHDSACPSTEGAGVGHEMAG